MSSVAHPTDIYGLAVTDKFCLSASGSSSLKVHSTVDPDFPLVQSLDDAHKLGCHHVVTNAKGLRAASIGFGGEIAIWSCHDGVWAKDSIASGR